MKNIAPLVLVVVSLFSCTSQVEEENTPSQAITPEIAWDYTMELEFIQKAIDLLSLHQQPWISLPAFQEEALLAQLIQANTFQQNYSSFANLVTWREGIRSADIFWSMLFQNQGSYSVRQENGDLLDIWIGNDQRIGIFSGVWIEEEMEGSVYDQRAQARRGQSLITLLKEQEPESLQWVGLEDGIHGGVIFEAESIQSLSLLIPEEDWQYSAYYIFELESHRLVYAYLGVVTPPEEPDYGYSQVFWDYGIPMDLRLPQDMGSF